MKRNRRFQKKKVKRTIKLFRNENYELLFNMKSGMEILQGTNGKEDPFSLELPSLIDVGIMGHCQNKCEFCYQGHKNQKHMSLKNFIRIIDEVKHHTNQVALGGRGDPNLHPQFKEITEYARNNHVVPNYTTSGINLTDYQIKISENCGAVAVSDYERDFTYESIKRFIDHGIKTNIHMIFDKNSYYKSIKILYGYNPWEILEGKRSEGVKKISKVDIKKLNAVIFLLFKRTGAASNLENRPTKSQIAIFSELVFKPKSKFKIGMDSCLVNHVLNYGTPHKIQKMSIDTCEAARMSGYITPDMKMMPCSFANEEKWAVPIGKKDIYTIWNKSDPFKRFRYLLRKNPDKCPLNL